MGQIDGMAPTSILLVDDDPDIRDLLGAFLAREVLETATAANGAEMDAAMARRMPDLIVLDLMLPGRTGSRSAAASPGTAPRRSSC